jgi:iron complex outermembrane receptor protein
MQVISRFRGCTVAGALIAAAASVAVPSQTASAQSVGASPVEEITVTARRREESLKDVPIAVSAYTGEALDMRGATDITELQKDTPNLTLQVARGSNSTLIAFIRGVGQQDPLWGFDPGVGLYVDDVYIARPQGAVLDIFDVERIEVLRGPQGTLYGRNTIGGAVKYVTRRIGNENNLSIRGAAGTDSQADLVLKGAAALTDRFAVSAAVATYNRDGYGTNETTGQDHYDKDVLAGRLSLEFTPTDELFFRLSADRTEDDSSPKHGYRIIAPSGDTIYDTFAGIGDDNAVTTEGVSLLAEWSLNESVTLKSISAWREGRTDTLIDFDGLPEPLLDVPAYYADDQFSQEFQVLYSGARWQAVGGLYFLDASAEGAFDTVIGAFGLTTFTAGTVDTESIAAFADVSFDLTDRLAVSVGGRWTRDEKTADQLRQNYLGLRSPLFGNDGAILLGPPNTDYTNSRDFDEFTPRVSLSYALSPELSSYASYSRGFKSGGFDMRGDALAFPDTVLGYEPEIVDSFEIGLKGTVAERLIFATAFFRSDYEDQQITSQFLIPPTTIVSFVDNAGSSELWGWEFEGTASFTDRISVRLSLGYIDAQFNEFVTFNPATGQRENLADEREFQNTPEWNGALALDFRFPLAAGGTIAFIPSAAYRGDSQMFEFATPGLDQPSYWLYDSSLVWTSESERYRLGLHGKNLTDEEYRVGGYNFNTPLTGNALIGFYGPPRTWTASFEVGFF